MVECVADGSEQEKQIPNFYMSTARQRVVSINFDENEYEAVVDNDGKIEQSDGILFLNHFKT